MAQSSRELVKAFAESIGLDPKHVAKLTLEADAKFPVLVATVTMYPEMTPEQQAKFLSAIEANGKQFSVNFAPLDLDGD